jgi:hypothetical protein
MGADAGATADIGIAGAAIAGTATMAIPTTAQASTRIGDRLSRSRSAAVAIGAAIVTGVVTASTAVTGSVVDAASMAGAVFIGAAVAERPSALAKVSGRSWLRRLCRF